MTEDQTTEGPRDHDPSPSPDGSPVTSMREPFPFVRLFYAIGFSVVASLAFWVIVLLAVLQFITFALAGSRNEELRHFSHLMARYVQEVFDFVTLARDERPFPLGPFPKD